VKATISGKLFELYAYSYYHKHHVFAESSSPAKRMVDRSKRERERERERVRQTDRQTETETETEAARSVPSLP